MFLLTVLAVLEVKGAAVGIRIHSHLRLPPLAGPPSAAATSKAKVTDTVFESSSKRCHLHSKETIRLFNLGSECECKTPNSTNVLDPGDSGGGSSTPNYEVGGGEYGGTVGKDC